jgi:hypothetical protein
MTHTATATTINGINVRIILDENQDGTANISVWNIGAEKYLYAPRKNFENGEIALATAVERCKLTRVTW